MLEAEPGKYPPPTVWIAARKLTKNLGTPEEARLVHMDLIPHWALIQAAIDLGSEWRPDKRGGDQLALQF